MSTMNTSRVESHFGAQGSTTQGESLPDHDGNVVEGEELPNSRPPVFTESDNSNE